MKKKFISLLLAAALACTAAVPAAAAGANDRLNRVTAKVKRTLGLDTTAYSKFYGEPMENLLAGSWFLEWNGDGASLNINATDAGKILSYHAYENTTEPSSGGNFAPSFPAGDATTAQAAAQAFLDRVLDPNETATIEPRGTVRLGMTRYRFGGDILVNGLPAGLSYSISVNCDDNSIQSFNRDDLAEIMIGKLPGAKAKIDEAAARASLRTTIGMRLEYVRQGDSAQAVLRYLPEYGNDYYVDALTGELIDLTALGAELEKGGLTMGAMGGAADAPAAAEDSAANESLSRVELEGSDKLRGVKSRDALDKLARKITALGLESYTLSSCNYNVPREEAEDQTITAVLAYGKQVNGRAWRRTVTLNAKTGELLGVYSSQRMPEEAVERPMTQAAAQEKAAAFLTEIAGAPFTKTALYDKTDALASDRTLSHSFCYAQKANGYFFPANQLTVGIDATDGSISAYQADFDESVTFESPDGIVSMDAAIDAWLATYDVPLGYIRVPTALDYNVPEYRPLVDAGVGYLYTMKLGYDLQREDYLLGIAAKTGKPVASESFSDEALTYTDLANHWARAQIETLAKYGVGYTGGAFRPSEALTQCDLLALLVSTDGYRYHPENEGAADELYELAFSMGLLGRDERAEEAVLTRAQAVRLILRAMGYRHVAELEGIFKTRFADDAAIPTDCYGYVALAQGLGMITGDDAGKFQPTANATRAQAAVMLYQFMAR